MQAQLLTVQDDGVHVQLRLALSPRLREEQRRLLAQDPEQRPVETLSIVLGPSLGAAQEQLPEPPATVELLATPEERVQGRRVLTVLRVSDADQLVLTDYAQRVGQALGSPGWFNPSRSLHLGLAHRPTDPYTDLVQAWDAPGVDPTALQPRRPGPR